MPCFPRSTATAAQEKMRSQGSCTVIVGCQWGDEGKGKIVDVLAENVDIVARYQGGANAGHTVHVGDDEFILHQIPSGVLHQASAAFSATAWFSISASSSRSMTRCLIEVSSSMGG